MKYELVWGGVAFLFAAGLRWIMPDAKSMITLLVVLGAISILAGIFVKR